jgi:hypothetical protein
MKLFEGTIASVKNMFGVSVKEKPIKGSLESIAIPLDGGEVMTGRWANGVFYRFVRYTNI